MTCAATSASAAYTSTLVSTTRLKGLAPALLVGECRLGPARRLRDRVVLLLEPLESAVELVEVSEELAAQLGDVVTSADLAAHLVEPATDFGEPAVDFTAEERLSIAMARQ